MRLDKKKALITGAAQGIGKAIAERLASEGARVFLSDINEAKLKETALALDMPYKAADASKKAEIKALVAAVLEAFGHLDIVVNNAGIIHAAELIDLEEEDFDRVLAVNLKSAFLLTQEAARHMIPRATGSIINMSSVNAVITIPNQIPYAVSKGALNQLTKVTSIALSKHNIRVNGVGPGTIDTAIAAAVIPDVEAERRVMSRTPLGRRGQSSEVASVVAFLASDDASYITGQTIYPDGGRLGLNYTV
ncbi:SDR family NAD(P)-dependent oxidoreductase [Brucella cytisi]|uniref:SDR family NAD(P)-dependent oxidoreductase n=1 Tax=Brucella cytisi TaxID=407152 RepID=UPI0035D5C20B